jgi:hypothetical protein
MPSQYFFPLLNHSYLAAEETRLLLRLERENQMLPMYCLGFNTVCVCKYMWIDRTDNSNGNSIDCEKEWLSIYVK